MNKIDSSLSYIPHFAEDDIKREKQKARALRATRWWRKKCSSGRCYYCGRFVGPNRLTMDHLVPLARGGRSIKANLVPACKECNTKKRAMLPYEWDEYLSGLKS